MDFTQKRTEIGHSRTFIYISRIHSEILSFSHITQKNHRMLSFHRGSRSSRGQRTTFKPIEEETTTSQRPKSVAATHRPEQILAESDNRIEKIAAERHRLGQLTAEKFRPPKTPLQGKIITVIKNSQPPQPHVTFTLNARTAHSLEHLMAQITAQGILGVVRRLCTLDGRKVRTLEDLFKEGDTRFVAMASHEVFPRF